MATILVVDDEDHNRLLLSTILGSVGHSVLEAGSGAEAMTIAQEHRPDLIVVDLSLPDMNGTHLIKLLRGDPQLGDVRVALYTASSVSAPMLDFMELMRIRCTIPKPSEPEDILNTVKDALA